MKLNKQQQNAANFLKEFACNLAEGKAISFEGPVIGHLEKMGIKIDFISHKEVESVVRGKGEPFEWVITNAPWYIRGKVSRVYLPFQVKSKKLKRGQG